MLRRDFLALGSLALASCVVAHAKLTTGPNFWLVKRGRGQVFVLGFGEAKDKSWFTPVLQRALQESSQLWLEVGPPTGPDTRDDATKKAEADQVQKLQHESGRTFFDVLEPSVRPRVRALMEKTGVRQEAIETLRPWWAYYVLNGAYWSHNKPPYEPVAVDDVLRKLAVEQGKSIHYEMPSFLDFASWMAAMPDTAQSQYIAWLLDFIDERDSGAYHDDFDWIAGHPPTRSLDRMRTRYPQLYEAMQPRRNAWWAKKIDELLSMGGTAFIGIGQLHVLGPDGIPQQLLRRSVVSRSQLHENPML